MYIRRTVVNNMLTDSCIQFLMICNIQCLLFINPPIIIFIQVIIFIVITFKVNPFCKFTEFSFSIIQSSVHHSLQNVKLPYNAFCHKIYYVGETLCAACSRVVLEEISQLFNHQVIAQCVITCNTQTLGKADEYLVYIEGSLLTLPEMLNLSGMHWKNPRYRVGGGGQSMKAYQNFLTSKNCGGTRYFRHFWAILGHFCNW